MTGYSENYPLSLYSLRISYESSWFIQFLLKIGPQSVLWCKIVWRKIILVTKSDIGVFITIEIFFFTFKENWIKSVDWTPAMHCWSRLRKGRPTTAPHAYSTAILVHKTYSYSVFCSEFSSILCYLESLHSQLSVLPFYAKNSMFVYWKVYIY